MQTHKLDCGGSVRIAIQGKLLLKASSDTKKWKNGWLNKVTTIYKLYQVPGGTYLIYTKEEDQPGFINCFEKLHDAWKFSGLEEFPSEFSEQLVDLILERVA